MLGLLICLVVLSFMYYSCLTNQKPNIWENIDYGIRWLISKLPGAANWTADKAIYVAKNTPGAANWTADKVAIAAKNAPDILKHTGDAAKWVMDKAPDAADQLLIAGQWAVNNAPTIKNPLSNRSKNVPITNVVSEPSQSVNGKSKEGFNQNSQDIQDMVSLLHQSKNKAILANTNAHKIYSMDSLGSSLVRPFMN